MLPSAYIVHQLGNRLRLRLPDYRGDQAFFAAAEQQLAACPAVEGVIANPLTAGLLIRHRGSLAELLAYAEQQQLFQLQQLPGNDVAALDIVCKRIDQFDRFVQRNAQGQVDLNDLLFFGLVGAGIVQIARGHALGQASSLFASAAAVLAVHRRRRAQSSDEPH